LREPDLAAARVFATINAQQGESAAVVADSRPVDLSVSSGNPAKIPLLLASVRGLSVTLHLSARVVINGRTGTVVMGRDV